ncbi:hypothetical protein [Pengzhenrongella sicca]|uniref:Uncharacterized protein n=1 Tax=Pengzhenrongella sicca TaxID=2819238 RepID=A0A8A4ZH66_9MICO|nr:hypothetical protein [Pengzhenrongella sicca]QTE30303.1 hypothetical protein J4E96_04685 [Pengzhenrongella sicca]
MLTLLIVLGAAALVLLLADLALTIRSDGYGTTPPPRSHPDDSPVAARGNPYF